MASPEADPVETAPGALRVAFAAAGCPRATLCRCPGVDARGRTGAPLPCALRNSAARTRGRARHGLCAGILARRRHRQRTRDALPPALTRGNHRSRGARPRRSPPGGSGARAGSGGSVRAAFSGSVPGGAPHMPRNCPALQPNRARPGCSQALRPRTLRHLDAVPAPEAVAALVQPSAAAVSGGRRTHSGLPRFTAELEPTPLLDRVLRSRALRHLDAVARAGSGGGVRATFARCVRRGHRIRPATAAVYGRTGTRSAARPVLRSRALRHLDGVARAGSGARHSCSLRMLRSPRPPNTPRNCRGSRPKSSPLRFSTGWRFRSPATPGCRRRRRKQWRHSCRLRPCWFPKQSRSACPRCRRPCWRRCRPAARRRRWPRSSPRPMTRPRSRQSSLTWRRPACGSRPWLPRPCSTRSPRHSTGGNRWATTAPWLPPLRHLPAACIPPPRNRCCPPRDLRPIWSRCPRSTTSWNRPRRARGSSPPPRQSRCGAISAYRTLRRWRFRSTSRCPLRLSFLAALHIPRVRQSQTAPFAEAVMAKVVPIAATAPMTLLRHAAVALPGGALSRCGAVRRAACRHGGRPSRGSGVADRRGPLRDSGFHRACAARGRRAGGAPPAGARAHRRQFPGRPGTRRARNPAGQLRRRTAADGAHPAPPPIGTGRLPGARPARAGFQEAGPAIAPPAPALARHEQPRPMATLSVAQPAPAVAALEGTLPRHELEPLEFHTGRFRGEPVGRPEWISTRVALMPPGFLLRPVLDKLEDPAVQPKPARKAPRSSTCPRPRGSPPSSWWRAGWQRPSCWRLRFGTGSTITAAAAARPVGTWHPADRRLPTTAPGSSSHTPGAAPGASKGAFAWFRQAIAERASVKVAEDFSTMRAGKAPPSPSPRAGSAIPMAICTPERSPSSAPR